MTHSVKPTLEHSSHANWQDGWIFVLACFFEKSWPFIFMLTKHDSCLSTNNLKVSFLVSSGPPASLVLYFCLSALIEILCLTEAFSCFFNWLHLHHPTIEHYSEDEMHWIMLELTHYTFIAAAYPHCHYLILHCHCSYWRIL